MGTVTISGVQTTTFGDVTGASNYHRVGFSGASFIALSTTDKGKTLISATRYLTVLWWCDEQDNEVIPTVDESGVPEEVINGAYELALAITNDPSIIDTGESGGTNTKRLKAGSAEIEFFRPEDAGRLPSTVVRLLGDYLKSRQSQLTTQAGGTDVCQPFGSRLDPDLDEGYA